MTSTDTDRLAEIRARRDAATEGHWYPISIEFRGQVSHSVKSAAGSVLAHTGYGPKGGSCNANAEFMAHARDDVPFLLSELEAAQARLDERDSLIRDLYDEGACWFDHHGYCQEHGWFETEPACPHGRAKALGLGEGADDA